VVASNGREALTLMQMRLPDRVMLDLTMPVMDGTSFLRSMRRRLIQAGQSGRGTVHISMSALQYVASDQFAFLRAVRIEHYSCLKHFATTCSFYVGTSKLAATGRASLPALRRCLSRQHQILRQMRFDPCLALLSIRTKVPIRRISLKGCTVRAVAIIQSSVYNVCIPDLKLTLPGKIA